MQCLVCLIQSPRPERSAETWGGCTEQTLARVPCCSEAGQSERCYVVSKAAEENVASVFLGCQPMSLEVLKGGSALTWRPLAPGTGHSAGDGAAGGSQVLFVTKL